jgi:predicted nicotinamide N-methyase
MFQSILQTDPPTRARLLHRIHRKYQTVTEEVRFGDLRFPFTRIANPDKVLDEVVAEEDRREKISGERIEDPLHMPYWAELWDSAGGLATTLAGIGIKPRAKVLDLGCGMGLSGTVAAALGANVLFADLETPALLFAQLNSLPFTMRTRTRRVNWQNDQLGEKFDLILGADILYERQQWEFLDAFWQEHLAPGGSILLGEPGRQTGEMFVTWIEARGWRFQESAQPVPTRPKPIRIFQLGLK